MQFPCTQKNGPPDRVPWEFGKDLQCQCQPMPHTFCPHSTPPLPGMASSCCECTVCVGRANIIPGQPWLLLQGAISCYVLAFAPNHRHPCLTVPPNWPFGDCLLPSCIGLCYISPSWGRKSPLYPHLECNMLQRMAVVWIGLRCFRLNAPQRAVFPGILLHTHTFLTLIFWPQDLIWNANKSCGQEMINSRMFKQRQVLFSLRWHDLLFKLCCWGCLWFNTFLLRSSKPHDTKTLVRL